jgi:hypothetical protein
LTSERPGTSHPQTATNGAAVIELDKFFQWMVDG